MQWIVFYHRIAYNLSDTIKILTQSRKIAINAFYGWAVTSNKSIKQKK